ncbi:MAG: hypothetical protein HY656_09725 [Acidobacteria bacterium]|nr:hypothetical protein [Acidobacteriota bacterium]
MASRAEAVPGQPRYARRTLVVNWGFQLRALIPLLVLVGIFMVLALGVVFFPVHRAAANEPDWGIRAILRAQLASIHVQLWPLLGVATLFSIYLSWRRSLRVAGPLYRLHRTLNDMIEGDYKVIQFREGDEFRVFEDDIAQLGQKMKLISTRNRDILVVVHNQVKRLSDRLAGGDVIARADLEEAVQAMRTQLEKAPELGLGTPAAPKKK